jgi:uncharacterized RDD family membrane protein YckC
MEKIQIETTQNVTIDYDVASIGDRILAALLDYLIIFGYMIALLILASILENSFPTSIAFWIIVYLPIFFYDLACELFLDGQSFGKKIRKIKVVKLDGTQPTFINYFLRWIIRPIDVTFTYGTVAMITMFINGKGQRIGDIAANTSIIKLKKDLALEDTIYKKVDESYDVQFPEVSNLTDGDIGIIQEVLDQIGKITDHYVYEEILSKTKTEISHKLGINSDLRPLSFLYTVMKDYNYINGK